MTSIKNKKCFCSWSGGKDSCLALYHAIKNGGIATHLFTMLEEGGTKSRSHGLPLDLLQAQADALGMTQCVKNASWNDYEKNFLSILSDLQKQGIEFGVFGDIDLDAHLEWVERVCSSANITAYEPLWKRPRKDLLEEFLNLGFKTMIISVKEPVLDKKFLGQILSDEIIKEFKKTGIDISGEAGEYHTVVIDGPIFSAPLDLQTKDRASHDGYCFLNVELNK